VLTVGNSAVRTAHFSLRAHRNRTLLAWQAAKQQDSTVTLPINPTTLSPLGRNDAFASLSDVGQASYNLKLFPASLPAPTNVSADLTSLEHTMKITLDDFGGVDSTMLGNLRIVQMSLAIIPFGGGVRSSDLTADGLGATVTFDPAVPASVKGAPPPTLGTAPVGSRLYLAPTTAGSPLFGTSLDSANGTGMNLTLPNPSLLYDAIFSVSYSVPSTKVTMSTAGMS